MKLEELSAELKAKALACKTAEDLLALAKEEGYELTDEQVEAVSGGKLSWDCDDYTDPCPKDRDDWC